MFFADGGVVGRLNFPRTAALSFRTSEGLIGNRLGQYSLKAIATQTSDGYNAKRMETKPREYSFFNAAGEVFYEIAYSRQDVYMFARMHKATKFKPTEYRSTSEMTGRGSI